MGDARQFILHHRREKSHHLLFVGPPPAAVPFYCTNGADDLSGFPANRFTEIRSDIEVANGRIVFHQWMGKRIFDHQCLLHMDHMLAEGMRQWRLPQACPGFLQTCRRLEELPIRTNQRYQRHRYIQRQPDKIDQSVKPMFGRGVEKIEFQWASRLSLHDDTISAVWPQNLLEGNR